METIRQRIERQMREFSKSHPTKDGNLLQLREDAVNFIVPACEEQQKIDIRRAVEWLKDKCFDDSLYSFDMDEFEQAMKGEEK